MVPSRLAANVVVGALLVTCGATPEPTPTPRETAPDATTRVTTSTSPDDTVDFVVVISVDGLNPDAIRRLGSRGAPALHRMIEGGAGTLNARTDHELTRTLPNHTGMLTGRPVAGPDGHRVTFNEDNGGTVHAVAGGYVAGVFDVVHDRGLRTSFFVSKDKFDFLDRSWDAQHGSPDGIGTDDGRDKIDSYALDGEADNVTRLVNRLRNRPDHLALLHLAQPDTAGHAAGFMSPAYLRAVQTADRQIGRILDAVRTDASLRHHVSVIVTADHGGRGDSHADPTSADNYTVPFLVWGPGVAAGADLYALNEDRRSRPGHTRTGYADTQPIRNGEVANLVTDLLDLPDVPGSVFNRRHLRVS